MKMPSHVLTADGHVATPRLNIIIHDDGIEHVRERAIEIVQTLAATGVYFRFTLYSVADGNDVFVESYRADVQKPVVTVS